MSWRAEAEAALAEGYTFLLNLTAVDEVGRSDHIRVLLRLLDPKTGGERTIDTLAERDDPHVADLADLFPGPPSCNGRCTTSSASSSTAETTGP